MHLKLLALVAAASTVTAQAPSFCDKYTTALFNDNTAANQYKLLVAVVNTAVIGNYTETKNGAVVAGILAPGQVGGASVDLLPYFNGVLASTNQGGSSGVSVNFLDDGGASALKAGRPSNGKTSRHLLLTHLYEFFGTLLGCSQQGVADFPQYSAHSSMYNVHKFMVLSSPEVTYFIEQVAASALSFGVTPEDIAPIGQVLMNLFGFRCSPPATAIPYQGDQLQSICSAPDCPIAYNSTCVGVQNITHPAVAIPGVIPMVPSKNTTYPNSTYPNGTYPGRPGYCNPARCPCGCKGAICPCGYTDCNGPQCNGNQGSGNGGSGGQGGAGGQGGQGGTGGQGGAGGAGGSGSGNNGGSGSGGSGSGSSGSGSGSGAGGNGTVPGGNGGFTPTTVSTAGAAALGMSFIGVVGGAIAFFFL
ncbi:hypothetical protein IFR05_008318 [Cadophora sp. M221]|nr:hypothetical protein IFR05_008318 [Cadophora sp. M221]